MAQREKVGCNRARAANGLGWFSIGLGAAEILAPRLLSRWMGVRNRAWLMRLLGAREIAAGVGILASGQPAGWLWSRVAGDAMDLALLGAGLAARGTDKGALTTATVAVAGVTALDAYCGVETSRQPGFEWTRPARMARSIIVNRSPEECFAFWRDFERLPQFMERLEAVQVTGPRTSHWRAKAPAGLTLEWDAEIVEESANSRIAWRSLPGAAIAHSGSVRFERAPGGRGTLVAVELEYGAPGGAIGAKLADLLGMISAQQLNRELRRYKQILETGEVTRSDASIHSGAHPAQPPREAPPPVETAPFAAPLTTTRREA